MQEQDRQLVIGPNCAITRAGLMVNGRFELMGHAERFAQIVRMTTPAVATALSMVFPAAKAVPVADGTIEASGEPAWEHYNRHAQRLQNLPAASKEAVAVSRTLLQWCIAAVAAAEVAKLKVAKTPEFLAVEFLAEYGPKAAHVSPAQWDAHQLWLVYDLSTEAMLAGLEGNRRKSPLPASFSIVAPWPEYLGVDLGGLAKQEENLCYLAPDIICDPNQTLCRFRNHYLRLERSANAQWVAQVDQQAQGSTSEFFECALAACHDGIDYNFRVQRTLTQDGARYAFRMLRSSVVSL